MYSRLNIMSDYTATSRRGLEFVDLLSVLEKFEYQDNKESNFDAAGTKKSFTSLY